MSGSRTAAWVSRQQVMKACDLRIVALDEALERKLEDAIQERMKRGRLTFFGTPKPFGSRDEAIASLKADPVVDELAIIRRTFDAKKRLVREIAALAKASSDDRILLSLEHFTAIAMAWEHAEAA